MRRSELVERKFQARTEILRGVGTLVLVPLFAVIGIFVTILMPFFRFGTLSITIVLVLTTLVKGLLGVGRGVLESGRVTRELREVERLALPPARVVQR